MKKIVCIAGSRADESPLSSVIHALGKHAIIIKTSGLYGHERVLLQTLQYNKPDMVLLLGDRYETLVAGSISSLLGIPIAHIHGGDRTLGSVDDQFRNAISKLSYFHFPACQLHADRLIAMGENPENIFVCGAPGVDNLVKPVDEIILPKPMALVCYHPETLGSDDMTWTEQLSEYASVAIAGANADNGGEKINAFWQNFAKGSDKIQFHANYPQKLWLSLMQHADVLIGNSSGFIFEGMTLGKKVIMIGKRQTGRYEDAIDLFRVQKHPFGEPGTVGKKIAEKILSLEIPLRPIKYATARSN